MSVLGGNSVYDAVAGAYRYGTSKEGNRAQRTVAGGTSFAEQIQKTGNAAGKAKVERKRRYRELSEEAAEKRRQEMELIRRRQNMPALLAKRTGEAGRTTYAGTTEDMISSFAAYIAGL